jgi:hypothetical protein
VTLAQLRQAGIFAELAALFPSEAETQALLSDLGVSVQDLTRLPSSGTSSLSIYWRKICERIDLGIFPGIDLDRLIAAASAAFPGNARLAALAASAGGGSGSRPGAAQDPGELRVLCLLACPRTAAELRLREELRIIRDALRIGHRPVKTESNTATRRNDVLADILDAEPDILHFSGHGSDDGKLLLEDDNGRPGVVTVDALAQVLELLPRPLTCLVLGSCYGGMFAERLLGPVRTVVGSVTALPDQAALEFTRGFYTALGKAPAGQREGADGTGLAELAAFAYRGGLAQMNIRGHDTASMRIQPELSRPGVGQ